MVFINFSALKCAIHLSVMFNQVNMVTAMINHVLRNHFSKFKTCLALVEYFLIVRISVDIFRFLRGT